LRLPVFRALWIASVASNVGTWMHEVADAWLMTTLTPSPLLVALLQSAEALPIFMLALPSGALADVVDRRRLLLGTQTWMLAVAATLGVITLMGAMTPLLLLALTVAMGVGIALNMPAWQALTPELVGRKELPAAVALGGVGLNLARVVGPAVGGLLVAAIGPGYVFLLNAVSFVGVIVVLYQWRREPMVRTLPAEDMLGAMRAGARYVRHSPRFRAVLIRTALVLVCSSAMWALLPVVARRLLGLGSMGYGAMLGCLGAGAVLGAAVLPRLRRQLSVDALTTLATLLFAGVLVTLAEVRIAGVIFGVMVLAGIAHMTLISSSNVAAQTAVASWVRARALAVYLLVFQGAMAAGGFLWGTLAQQTGLSIALLIAAAGLVMGLLAVFQYRLGGAETDLTPSQHWPVPVVTGDVQHDDGPVLVTVEYCIDPAKRREFAAAMRELRLTRLRDGAIRWNLFHDIGDEARYVETFVVESWAEHLRQHERATFEDQRIEDVAIAFHQGAEPPRVSHFLNRDVRSIDL
jgi:MFS family permease